jgi:hypothetical protein
MAFADELFADLLSAYESGNRKKLDGLWRNATPLISTIGEVG